jgi:argonaute-like protein implicated in RNA metabolism and viral defense
MEMYELDDFNSIHQPKKGMAFRVSSQDAFLVSSLPPSKSVTPLPIHIRSFNDFPIEKALHSILSLTLLHYGSERMPKLPVSVHYSDRIGYLAIRGIKPKNLEGETLYWL